MTFTIDTLRDCANKETIILGKPQGLLTAGYHRLHLEPRRFIGTSGNNKRIWSSRRRQEHINGCCWK